MKQYILVGIILTLSACSSKDSLTEVKVSGNTMGTTYHITYLDAEARNFSTQLDSMLVLFNEVFSTYDKNSVISRFNQSDTGIALIGQNLAWFRRMLLACDTVYAASGGAFNPAIGPLVRYWGFYEKETSLSVIPEPTVIDSLLQVSRYKNVHLDQQFFLKDLPGVYLDVNAVAPGFACDLLGEYLEQAGVDRYMIEIGGEVRARGKNATENNWAIGIMQPEELSKEMVSSISLENMSLATSGNYNKYIIVDGIKMGHTIDPNTGMPATNELLSATVITEQGVYADAYATACMASGLEAAMTLIESTDKLDAFLMYTGPDGKLHTWHSAGLNAYLTE